MQVVDILAREGGVCSRAELLAVASDRAIRRAVARGTIVRLRRGRYALPTAGEHLARAHQMSATLSHLSAWKAYYPWPHLRVL